jgi:branched-chain amino acid transport system permease protein
MSTVEAAPPVRVTRSRRSTAWAGITAIAGVIVLGYLPYLVHTGTTSQLTQFFMLLTMATMWNLLAGYAGLVSVGQQAFIGLGAYVVLILSDHGTNPYLAVPAATFGCAAIGLPIWWLVSRLRSGYFAITMWVVASVCELIIIQISALGGGTGAGLQGLNLGPTLFNAYTYWASLSVAVIVIAAVYLLLRSPVGLVLTAIRDDETGARSVGARVGRTQRLVFLVAAAGCGAAGAIYIISGQFVVPTAAFSVQWSADMIFITIIGGIGTIEGPVLGTIVFYALQQSLAQYGTWYFIVLGLIAMVVAIWAPRGLWGLISDRLGIRLFPVGYYLWPAGSKPRHWLVPFAGLRGETGPGSRCQVAGVVLGQRRGGRAGRGDVAKLG